jgi:hypothetical protein
VTDSVGTMRKPLSLNLPFTGDSKKVNGASWLAVKVRVITFPACPFTTHLTVTGGTLQFFGLLGKKKFL